MKTDGLFTAATYTHECKANVPFKLIIFGDVHRDSPDHAHDAWQDFLNYARRQENAVFLGMGDYLDSTSTSEREILERAGLHDTIKWDLVKVTKAKLDILENELSFLRGKLIGLLNGNHYFQFASGINSDMELCERLGCQYLGVSTLLRLNVATSATQRHSLDIFAHHGAGGGGRLVGGSMNRIGQMCEQAEADVFIQGHDHKRGVIPQNPKIYLENNARGGLVIKSRQQWLVRSGSFLTAYMPGSRNYNVDAQRGPCSIGHCELEITPVRDCRDGADVCRFDIRGIC